MNIAQAQRTKKQREVEREKECVRQKERERGTKKKLVNMTASCRRRRTKKKTAEGAT